jgi:CBS domain-containing protein
MKARDVMTWGVISVEPDASVERAAQLMLQNRISGLPVVDAQGALIGMVTEGDFLRRSEIGTKRQRPPWLEFPPSIRITEPATPIPVTGRTPFLGHGFLGPFD